jgi:CRISPR-associated protein Cas1
MRKLLNTLYITTPEAYLSKDGLNVVVSVKQEEVFRIPVMNIEGIVTFGYMGASPGLMKLCSDNLVSLTFLSPNGQFIGRLQSGTKGNVLLRKKQYQVSDDESMSLHLSQLFVAGKIHNYRSVLRRYIRDYGDDEDVDNVVRVMDSDRRNSFRTINRDQLRGVEGDAANNYFSVFNHLILGKNFVFKERNRRPPKDPVNAMLSFVYTLLANECAAALETVGLDPYVGFMHTLRPGRASLALDLMEEFRAYLGDRLVFTLINRNQVSSKDFKNQGEESVIMTDSCRKQIITSWQNRKKEEITHPYLKEKISVGLLPYAQAMLLARYLRGDLDDYPVFLI